MHQHPRPSPTSASPASSEQTNPTRTNNSRDRDVQALRNQSLQPHGSGSSEEFGNGRQDQSADTPSAQMQRLNQVIQNFHTKSALIILHSRVELAPAYSKNSDTRRVNRWFNIELDETDEYRDEIRQWRHCDLKDDRPSTLFIDVFLTTHPLQQGQRLVILDEDSKRWDIINALSATESVRSGKKRAPNTSEIILERWTIELGERKGAFPTDMTTILPLVYKKSIVLFRSLFTYCNFLPAWKLAQKIGKGRSTMAMKLGYRIHDGTNSIQNDNLELPLCDSTSDVTTNYSFGSIDSPAGPFSVQVKYRQNCDFRIDNSEELLSSRFLGAEDELFRPSMPGEAMKDDDKAIPAGSLPTDRRQHLFERPELGHAYGSMSTFHQAGIATGTSPMSTLRNAQDYSAPSPPASDSSRPPATTQQPSQVARSLRAQAATRRSSFTHNPFKTPTLSASPLTASPLGTSPRMQSGHVPVLGSLTEERSLPLPNAAATSARKAASLSSEAAIIGSASSSPKPAPMARYSSSFSHRRGRLSSGGTTLKSEEDQVSSGRASAASSAQPGSGLMAEVMAGGGSSGSMQEDDEDISDFLKMLDLKKDLLNPADAAAAEASTKRTTAALNKFHRMRDSNAALSDSMSSSLMLQRSSTSSSRQLSSVPPMVPATSASTSSSPGKPISPHTPHTPFAPSRLSAAYSHDDTEAQHNLAVEDESIASEATLGNITQGRMIGIPAIDIPNSPRPFRADYQRSSSVQPHPEDDIADLYGMRSASMGATDRRLQSTGGTDENPNSAQDQQRQRQLEVSPRRAVFAHRQTATLTPEAGDGQDSGAGRSSTQVYRSRLARGGGGRGVTPPQGSTSSFGGTAGGSAERGDDSTSASGSWGRGGRRSSSRPENRFDEDEFLPFAMEKSDFNTASRGGDDSGVSER